MSALVSTDMETDELLARCAEQNGVAPDVVVALMNLKEEFADFTVWGAKAEFARRVARILDAAAQGATAP